MSDPEKVFAGSDITFFNSLPVNLSEGFNIKEFLSQEDNDRPTSSPPIVEDQNKSDADLQRAQSTKQFFKLRLSKAL